MARPIFQHLLLATERTEFDAGAERLALALARRDGPILPVLTQDPDRAHVAHERHLCVDTTAAGGNAALLAG